MVWITERGPACRGCARNPWTMMNDSCKELFLKKISVIMPCFTKAAPLGWESREEPCVCLLLENALICFRRQCLWSAVQKCVCSAKCILFIWVSVLVCALANFTCLLPSVCVCLCLAECFVYVVLSAHTSLMCVYVCNVSLKGWRQDWTAVAAWLSCEAGRWSDGQYGGGMFAEGAYVHTHTQACRQHTNIDTHKLAGTILASE